MTDVEQDANLRELLRLLSDLLNEYHEPRDRARYERWNAGYRKWREHAA